MIKKRASSPWTPKKGSIESGAGEREKSDWKGTGEFLLLRRNAFFTSRRGKRMPAKRRRRKDRRKFIEKSN